MSNPLNYDIAELQMQLAEDKALEKALREDFLSGSSPEAAEALSDARAARKMTENTLKAAQAAQAS